MRLVISAEESIPEWLYPGTWPDLVTPVEDSLPLADRFDLNRLWCALQPNSGQGEALIPQSYEDVGIPHNAPESVCRVNAEFVEALLAIPAHDRWRIAQSWMGNPNKESLADAKRFLNNLCDLATRARESDKLLVLLPDEGTY